MLDPILVDSPVQFPGRCVCGNQTGPLVDTHIEIEGVGRIYLCERCIRTGGDLLGMVTHDQAVRLDDRAAVAEARVVELETELAEAAPILASIARAQQRYEADGVIA